MYYANAMSEHENKKTAQQTHENPVDVYEQSLATDRSAVETGQHFEAEHFEQPVVDSFGTFTKKWRYTDGCTIDTEFGKGVGELILATKTDEGKKRIVSIGRTPAAWDPKQGSQKILARAGRPGDYLMAVVDDAGTPDQTMSYRYLDPDDLAGVEIEHGGDLVFKDNSEKSGRMQIAVRGKVERVVGLLA